MKLISESSPVDVYQLLVNDEIINHNVLKTNRYTKQIIASNPPTKNSRLYKWSDTNAKGIKFLFGLVYFTNNEKIKQGDRLAKVQPF